MRKKAALGCALIHNPPVLFLDEPLEGVDPVSGDVIRRLLTRFVGSDSTVLFSSHVMELVEQVCDHVSIIDKGKIVVTGTIDEVRGGKTLQRAFIDLVGPRAADKEVLSWLGSSPRRSRCTPLRTRGLAVGLLAASFTGFWPLANVIGLLGVTVGLASGAFGVIVAVVAVVLQVLFCIALSRFMTTSLASMLRSRRGRDLAAFMIIPLFALYEFFTQVVPKAVSEGKITAASFTGFDSWMRWLPPGLAAHAIQDASGGRPGMAFARLGALAAVIVVFVWLWVRSLGRALVTADTTTQSSRVRGTRLPLAGLGLRGTVAARFWLYQRREPLSLVYWALVAVITAAPSASSVFGHKHHPAVILASAVFGTAFVGIFHANSAGLTGPAFVLEATALGSSRDLRAYFSGQNLVLCVIGAPLVVAVCFALAAVVGDPGMGVEATPVVLAGIGAALGLGDLFIAALPYPMVKRVGAPVLVPAPGYAGYRIGSLLTLAGTAVLAAPVIVGAMLAANGPDAIRIGVMLPCAAAYGFALAVIGVRLAAKVAESTLPEMCQVALRAAT